MRTGRPHPYESVAAPTVNQSRNFEAAETGTATISVLSRQKPLVVSAALSLAVIGVALVAVLAGLLLWTSLSSTTATCAVAAYLALAAVVLSRVSRFHPFRSFGLANLVTTARAAVACGLLGLLVEHHVFAMTLPGATPLVVVWIVGASLLLDGVDGWIARRQNLVSRFGARFDMEVDAFTILALAALAVTLGKVGVFALGLGLMRYAFIAAGRIVPALTGTLPDRFWRKVVCVLQYGALLVTLLPAVEPGMATAVAAAALLALMASFGTDVVHLLRQDARRKEARR